MADRWASIYGTEKDKYNCPFYFKIGSCRHGDKCARAHNRPSISPTILVPNMYQFPEVEMTEDELQESYDNFYEDVFTELSKFGKLDDLLVCSNFGEHLIGNVYAKFRDERDADAALKALNGRYYAGRLIKCEFSPVTDFREAKCRQFDNGDCGRGGYCNFMHLKPISPDLERDLWGSRRRRSGRRKSRSRSRERRRRSRSRSRERRRRRSTSRSRSRSRSGDRDRDRSSRRSHRSSRSHRSKSREREDKDRKDRKRHRSESRSQSRDRKSSRSPESGHSHRNSDRHSQSPDTKRQKLQEDHDHHDHDDHDDHNDRPNESKESSDSAAPPSSSSSSSSSSDDVQPKDGGSDSSLPPSSA